jgi:hypothetical protein
MVEGQISFQSLVLEHRSFPRAILGYNPLQKMLQER